MFLGVSRRACDSTQDCDEVAYCCFPISLKVRISSWNICSQPSAYIPGDFPHGLEHFGGEASLRTSDPIASSLSFPSGQISLAIFSCLKIATRYPSYVCLHPLDHVRIRFLGGWVAQFLPHLPFSPFIQSFCCLDSFFVSRCVFLVRESSENVACFAPSPDRERESSKKERRLGAGCSFSELWKSCICLTQSSFVRRFLGRVT